MDDHDVKRRISADFPELKLEGVSYLGEGYGNLAFLINEEEYGISNRKKEYVEKGLASLAWLFPG